MNNIHFKNTNLIPNQIAYNIISIKKVSDSLEESDT